MLFDPRHDKNPNMAGFALYCASKPANETYNWMDRCGCAVGQYLKSIGINPDNITWVGEIDTMNVIARGAPFHQREDKSDHVFGKLSERILKHQMKEKA